MKQFIVRLIIKMDLFTAFVVYPSAWVLKIVRAVGVEKLPSCKKALLKVGVFPLRAHYYEPQFDYQNINQPLSQDRGLPGIDWNASGQLKILSTFMFNAELIGLPQYRPDTLGFYMDNGSFLSGDAEYWYQLIRSVKPKKIFEVGSGNSTLMAIKAINENRKRDSAYGCKHVCIEPYEMPWLEEAGVEVIRKRVEDMDISFFSELEENDILFIDSSHIIRPQGDVLFEYLELLPTLNKGVIVHIHDIFSPKNYLKSWLEDKVLFWNEQYLLEAFLSNNNCWKIIGALNYLHHHHYNELKTIAPYLTPDREPGSFYIQKTT